MAAAAPPAAPRIDTAANCPEPANVVADMTVAANAFTPAACARTPNDAPNMTAASAIGAIARAPSR